MENSVVRNALCLTLLFALASCSIDFCQNHLFENVEKKNVVRFSKENSDREYAIVDGFKSMHCCSRGYRSIEWFKNGIPYPWSTDMSTLIILPESGNQTIYSPVISVTDSGKYWCVVRNDTHSIRHDVFLKVSGLSQLEEPPKATYMPRDLWAGLGTNARFYCEAFVGNISLPDAKSEIHWKKMSRNTTVPSKGRVRQEAVSREGNQILGSYLVISDLKMEDYGNYECTISNTGDQSLELTAALYEEVKTVTTICPSYVHPKGLKIAVSLLTVFAILITVFLVYFRPQVRMIYYYYCVEKRRVYSDYDILVTYHEKETEFALKKMVFPLQNRFHCKCVVHPIATDKLVCKAMKKKARKCRRVLILVSLALAENDWSSEKLNSILKSIIDIHPRIILVLLQPLPQDDQLDDATGLQDLLKRVFCIEYRESNLEKFWDLMSLGLPVTNLPGEEEEADDVV